MLKWDSVPKPLKWLIYIFGTVFVGVVSSGIWDLIGRNFCFWVFDVITSMTTQWLRDDLYLMAAKWHGAEGKHDTDFLAVFLCMFIIMSSMTFRFHVRFKTKLEQKKPKPLSKLVFESRLIFIFATGIMLAMSFQYAKILYVNQIIANFNQCISITAPYLSDEQEEILKSKFASMTSKDDFTPIMEDLKEVASKNNKVLPDF